MKAHVQFTSEAERDESPSERADRNFGEIVQELRVAQTGVQILFAFLLATAFEGAFPKEDPAFVRVLTAALLLSAASAVSFMAPVAIHRLHFRQGGKEAVVWVAHWMSLAGLALLFLAMALAVWLVIARLWTQTSATWVSAGLLVTIALVWVALPAWLGKPPGDPTDQGKDERGEDG